MDLFWRALIRPYGWFADALRWVTGRSCRRGATRIFIFSLAVQAFTLVVAAWRARDSPAVAVAYLMVAPIFAFKLAWPVFLQATADMRARRQSPGLLVQPAPLVWFFWKITALFGFLLFVPSARSPWQWIDAVTSAAIPVCLWIFYTPGPTGSLRKTAKAGLDRARVAVAAAPAPAPC